MAANKYGIDVGGMYRDVESIKGARTQNKLAALKLSEQEREIAGRPERERIAANRANKLTGLRAGAVAGNQDSVQLLLAMDPKGGTEFMEKLGKMDDRQIEATKRTIDDIGKTAHSIMSIEDPVLREELYGKFYNQASPEIQKELSPKFNMGEMKLALNKASTMAQITENPKAFSVGGEDVVYQRGKEVERAKKPIKDGKGGKGGSGGVKAADESLMYKQSVELLGGIFDEAGNITNLDPATRNKIQRIATEAANQYVNLGNITRTEAVTRAAKKFGMSIPTDTGAPEVAEGQIINNPSTGETMIMQNGKWVPTK
jgi:hypothetical protein